MKAKEHRALVKKHGGWIEATALGGIARFPTVHACEQFSKEFIELTEAATKANTKTADDVGIGAIAS